MGTQLPFPKGGQSRPPPFSAPFYCGQMAGCVKMPLCMDVGLSPGDFVLGGDPVPSPQKAAVPPNFRPTSIVAKRCMDQDTAWYGGRRWPMHHCVSWGPSSPSAKCTQPPPNFRPLSVVAKPLVGLKMPLGMKIGLASAQAMLCSIGT